MGFATSLWTLMGQMANGAAAMVNIYYCHSKTIDPYVGPSKRQLRAFTRTILRLETPP